MKIERFEDIEVWKLSRIFINDIYKITDIDKFRKDFELLRQIRKASVSIISNIAEGFERKSNNELMHFLFIAKGSAGEVRSQLYVAKDIGYINEEEFEKLFQKIELISKSLSGFIKYIKSVS